MTIFDTQASPASEALSTQITPSKKVQSSRPALFSIRYALNANIFLDKAASGIETLKMGDSPAKKLEFAQADKENMPEPVPVVNDLELEKPVSEPVKAVEKVSVAPTIKPHEADEPLLQENPHRFVLFPIKYHEVRV